MTTTEENFCVHLETKRIRSYGRQAVVSWFAIGLLFPFFIQVGYKLSFFWSEATWI